MVAFYKKVKLYQELLILQDISFQISLDTLEKLHLKSNRSLKVCSPTKKIKPKMVNTEPSERNCAANVLVPQNQTSLDEPFSNQSIKTIKGLCDQVQSLCHTVNILERRLTMLEKTLRKLP